MSSQRMPPEQREQRLLEAARGALRERGFDVDIREILTRAGVGTGTAYRHFPNKEALVRAVLDELRVELEAGLSAASAEPDPCQGIAATMRLGFRLLARYGQVVVALFACTQPPEYEGAIDCAAMVTFFVDLLGRAVAEGQLPGDLDVSYSITAWLGLFNPIALSGTDGEPRDPDEVATATTRFFLAGLQAGPEPPDPKSR
jgi:AcrR family transcriptional regulator